MSNEVFLFDAVRTPRGRGRPGGGLYETKPIDLVTTLLRELEHRNGLDTERVDDIILGVVNPIGEQGSVLPKIAALSCGWSERVCGVQLNRFCASGLEAINTAAAKVAFGQSELIVAGGVESMSRVPMGSDGGPWAEDVATSIATKFVPQGISADLIATLDGVDRAAVDGFALNSHRKASAATRAGHFARSMVPVSDTSGLPILDRDELIRHEATGSALAQLKPAFDGMGAIGFDAVVQARYPEVNVISHVHTAGNSSGIADGAALVLLGTAEAGRAAGLTPRAKISRGTVTSGDPTMMLAEPAPVTRKLLKQARLRAEDVDLFEVNEAFASVVLRCISELRVDPDLVNVNGGAIAMGHPLGATGAVLIGTLVDELERRDLKRGLATLCAAGGMGIATLVERA
ncbi:acetyl-CoA C-acetyltransferase [Bradyrhizobium sp. CSA207]|uniref:acetyl-CoA C-acetyltransferase n=1 Tax=Bradyrhizobium sp. CSA207 TaxID=2698826 RepID=UPI0023AF4069|nr:acetyl-CoA C-acetyltransferase [Bradyrhizobium sp. CSA207]MDE5445774.1 acetyl-CoA C-acetyltransferase [Bradyrhizobium sp. CSA207]